VNGPDDLIGAQGDAALWQIVDAAKVEEFVRDKKSGAIVANSLDNIRLALRRAAVHLSYDEFRREPLINGVPADDLTLDQIWVQIDDLFRFRPSKETLRTVIVTEALRGKVHPVRDYLDGLHWDGTPRLDEWLVTYGGADDSAYVRAVGALPLLAAVRRVRRPGTKFDELLILESGQGKDKSSALRALCPNEDWFSDDLPLGVDSKEVIERTIGKWIIEASELHGNRGREAEQLKAFLSRQVDGPVRQAYGRLPVEVRRQFVLIGTTNANVDREHGFNTVEIAREALGLAIASERFGATYFSNGAQLGGVLSTSLTGQALENLRTAIAARHQGVDRAHRWLLTPPDSTFTEVGTNPRDSQLTELREHEVREIARFLRIPVAMIGDLSRATWSNFEQQQLQYFGQCIRPWCVNIEQELTLKLVSPFERSQQYIEHVTEGFLRADIEKRGAYYVQAVSNGWMTLNEVRERENLPPLPGGDVARVPMNTEALQPVEAEHDAHPNPQGQRATLMAAQRDVMIEAFGRVITPTDR
jgi:hypothetical protein